MKCIILAGGYATRLWPLTENKAKPLLHLKDRPLISHIVDQIPEDVEIIVSTNMAFEEDFKEWAKPYGSRIKIFVEDSGDDAGKKGALGATALVIEQENIKDDLMLIAGDNYFGFCMQDFLNRFEGNPLLAAYDIKDLNKAKKFGVVVQQDGKVKEFQEKPEEPKSTLVSTGCFLFPQKNLKDIIHHAKEHNDDLGGVFEYLKQEGEDIDVYRFDALWYDIGSFDAYMAANKELITHDVIEKEGVSQENNKLSGSVYLGPNVTVKNSTLENVIVLDNTTLDDVVIRNSVIDHDCQLKGIDLEGKMVRKESKIER